MDFSGEFDYQTSKLYRLKDLPLVLTLEKNNYALIAVIMFSPAECVGGMGHFVAAIRLNEKFEVFDDLRDKPYEISNNVDVYIHALLYLRA